MIGKSTPQEDTSCSTEVPARKFCRRSHRNSSDSNRPTRSESGSLSKFYVANIRTEDLEQTQKLIYKPIRRDATPASKQTTNQRKQGETPTAKQMKPGTQGIQVQRLRGQILRYQNENRQHCLNLQIVRKENMNLKTSLEIMKHQIEQLSNTCLQHQQKVRDAMAVLSEKQKIFDLLQRQHDSLKQAKDFFSIVRISELEQEKSHLESKIKSLQKQITEYASNATTKRIKSEKEGTQNNKSLHSGRKSLDDSTPQQRNLQKQLFTAKQQIKRMQVAENWQRRKLYKQLEEIKQKKQKQYQQLRDKFNYFLSRHKQAMKKLTSYEAQQARARNKDRNLLEVPVRPVSRLDSVSSLTLSEDD